MTLAVAGIYMARLKGNGTQRHCHTAPTTPSRCRYVINVTAVTLPEEWSHAVDGSTPGYHRRRVSVAKANVTISSPVNICYQQAKTR